MPLASISSYLSIDSPVLREGTQEREPRELKYWKRARLLVSLLLVCAILLICFANSATRTDGNTAKKATLAAFEPVDVHGDVNSEIVLMRVKIASLSTTTTPYLLAIGGVMTYLLPSPDKSEASKDPRYLWKATDTTDGYFTLENKQTGTYLFRGNCPRSVELRNMDETKMKFFEWKFSGGNIVSKEWCISRGITEYKFLSLGSSAGASMKLQANSEDTFKFETPKTDKPTKLPSQQPTQNPTSTPTILICDVGTYKQGSKCEPCRPDSRCRDSVMTRCPDYMSSILYGGRSCGSSFETPQSVEELQKFASAGSINCGIVRSETTFLNFYSRCSIRLDGDTVKVSGYWGPSLRTFTCSGSECTGVATYRNPTTKAKEQISLPVMHLPPNIATGPYLVVSNPDYMSMPIYGQSYRPTLTSTFPLYRMIENGYCPPFKLVGDSVPFLQDEFICRDTVASGTIEKGRGSVFIVGYKSHPTDPQQRIAFKVSFFDTKPASVSCAWYRIFAPPVKSNSGGAVWMDPKFAQNGASLVGCLGIPSPFVCDKANILLYK